MGANFYSGCHLCKKKVFHFRRKENETLMAFYRAHAECGQENPQNLETIFDEFEVPGWIGEAESGGYKDQWEWDEETCAYKKYKIKGSGLKEKER